MYKKYKYIIHCALALLFCCNMLNGQTPAPVGYYEYWFDDHFAERTAINAPSGGGLTLTVQDVDARTLADGVHWLRFRARDDVGQWTVVYTQPFVKHQEAGGISVYPIGYYEYWFDDDFAGRKKINAQTSDVTLTVQTVDAGALTDGVHRLRFRARDDDGQWTVVYSQPFVKHQEAGGVSVYPIGYYEYWFDDDFAGRKKINAGASDVALTVQTVDAGALTDGVHRLRFRARDDDGQWTVVYSQPFVKHQEVGGITVYPIGYYEYWFDDDFAGRKKMNAGASDVALTVQTVDAGALTDGVHRLRFRARDDDGLWTVVYTQPFVKYQKAEGIVVSPITDYEYWFDDDFTNRKKITAQTPDVLLTVQTADASELTEGVHSMRFRVRNGDGQWSVVYSQKFFKPSVKQDVVENLITGYRYWFNDDFDSVEEIDIDPPVNPYEFSGNIPVPDWLAWTDSRKQAFHIQYLDAMGKWSVAVSDSFVYKGKIDVFGTLEATLASAGDYNDMKLLLTRINSGQSYTIATTAARDYSFTVPADRYRLTLVNQYGVALGTIDNIEIEGNEITRVVFDALLPVYTVRLRFTDATGKDLPAKPTVRWYDASGAFLCAADSISGLTAGAEIEYQLQFNEALGVVYVLPAPATCTVSAAGNLIVVRLSAIAPATITGSVKGENAGALSGAVVTVTQMINGLYLRTFSAKTAADGSFSVAALNDTSAVTISCTGYINRTVEKKNFDEGSNLGVLILKPITGAVVSLQLNYFPSVQAGEKPVAAAWYADYRNLEYRLKNVTKGRSVNDISVQYPDLVLLDDISEAGDEIEITVISRTGEFNVATGKVRLDEHLKASANIKLVQLGSLRATYTTSANKDNTGALYNASGLLVNRYDYSDGTFLSQPLPDGIYHLVSMAKSDYFNSLMDISQLSLVGLKQNTDYTFTGVDIESGVITEVQVGSIPKLDESKLYYTGANTLYTAQKSTLTAGSFQTFRAEIDYKKEYSARISNVKLIADIPVECAFTSNSILAGKKLVDQYSLVGKSLIVPLNDWSEPIRFCMIPAHEGVFTPGAFVEFDLDGETIRQPIGTAHFTVEELSFYVPKLVAHPEIVVTGAAPATADELAKVQVFDGNVLIGETLAKSNGNWSLNCTLHQARSYSTHYLHARVTTDRGLTVQSATKEVVHDVNAIMVTKVTMVNVAHPDGNLSLCEFATVFDFMEKKSTPGFYNYWPSYPDFTFSIDFSRNDPSVISDVNLYVFTSDGKVTTLPAVYDETKGLWVVSAKFHSAALPVNVNVDYIAQTKRIVDAGELKELYTMADDQINDYQNKMAFIANIKMQIQAELAKSDFDENKVENLLSELRTYLGVEKLETPEPDEELLNYLNSLSESELNEYLQSIMNDANALIAEIESLKLDQLLDGSIFGNYLFESDEMLGMFQITNCDGYIESLLPGQGFTAYETSEGYNVYSKDTEYETIIIDFHQNICFYIKIEALRQLSMQRMASGDFESKISEYIKTISDTIIDLSSAVTKLDGFIESVVASLRAYESSLLSSIETMAKNEMSFTFLEMELFSVQKAMQAIKLLGKACDLYSLVANAMEYIKSLSEWRSLFASVRAKCPEDLEKAEQLQNAIANSAYIYGGLYGARTVKDAAVVIGLSASIMGALETAGLSLLAGLAIKILSTVVTLVADEALKNADIKARQGYSEKIKALKNAKCKGKECEEGCQKICFVETDPDAEDEEICFCYCDPLPSPQTPPPCCPPGPKPILDPSGYVYEAVADNRLEGVTSTIFYKTWLEDMYGDLTETIVLWDAENYGQDNPLLTNEYGMYAWDVPQGLWQVKYEKAGYQTEYSEWLPVPPPQLEVNIGMTQYSQPYVVTVTGYEEGINIEFDKYMQPETFGDNVVVSRNGDEIQGVVMLLNPAVNPVEVSEDFASKIRFLPAMPFTTADEVVLTVYRNVKSYAGVGMAADYVQKINIQKELKSLSVTPVLNMNLHSQNVIEVVAAPGVAAAGKTVTAKSVSSMIATVTSGVALNAEGKALLQVSGELPGVAVVYISVDGTDLMAETKVQVSIPSPLLTVDRKALVFGSVLLETGAQTQTITTTGAYISGSIYYYLYGEVDDVDVFTVTETSWNGNNGGTLNVAFAPVEERSYNATLEIWSNGAPSWEIALSGAGITKTSVVPVTGVTLNPTSLSMKVGEEATLFATVKPDDATDKTVTWSSSVPAVASVTNGVVTALKAGNATITAQAHNGVKGECAITVTQQTPITGVENVFAFNLKLYPNPFTGLLQLSGAEGCKLQVISVNGEIVHTQNIVHPDETLRFENLPAGVYFFRLEKDGNVKTIKMVKN